MQQRYGAAEPHEFAEVGVRIDTYRLPTHGRSTGSTNQETRRELVGETPEVVQRSVNVSIDGWCNFLYGDHTLANEAIMAQDPEMTVGRFDAEMEQL